MDIIPQQVQDYAQRFTTGLDALLQKIEQETAERHPEAHMLSGALQGQLLRQLSYMIRPRRVLEIGTFVGFSALCLAEGLADDGEVHTIECRETDAETAAGYFRESVFRDRIRLHVGQALPVIEALKESWDLVFIDADKINYIAYYEAVLPKLRHGGWILADNIFFHGQVLETPVKGKNARAIDAFNAHVAADPRTTQVVLTVRDGLMIIRKT
jgi:predicted O-methyltransferase YrrM